MPESSRQELDATLAGATDPDKIIRGSGRQSSEHEASSLGASRAGDSHQIVSRPCRCIEYKAAASTGDADEVVGVF